MKELWVSRSNKLCICILPTVRLPECLVQSVALLDQLGHSVRHEILQGGGHMRFPPAPMIDTNKRPLP